MVETISDIHNDALVTVVIDKEVLILNRQMNGIESVVTLNLY